MGNPKVCIDVELEVCILYFGFNPFNLCLCFLFDCFQETKSDEDENLPSMESLEISGKSSIKQSPSYMGAEEEEDIPDMAEFEDTSNLIETDPVS